MRLVINYLGLSTPEKQTDRDSHETQIGSGRSPNVGGLAVSSFSRNGQ